MSQNFAQRFVDLGRARLAAQPIAVLCLDHRGGRFDVRTFVITLHEPFRVVAIEVKHLLPQDGLAPIISGAVGLERNVRHRVIDHAPMS